MNCVKCDVLLDIVRDAEMKVMHNTPNFSEESFDAFVCPKCLLLHWYKKK